MRILIFALGMIGLVCFTGCKQNEPYYQTQARYNEADAIRAAEYEKMQTQQYQQNMQNQQRNEYLRNSNMKQIQVNQ
ncbi:hypothetical protein SDC9_184437 [bioreactor metagenome]|uniref:Uncharacterized protein n=1 Tax=bioreactor metagenome TaxID=1076179 RepID=A0A645HD13_9ZZZZ